MSLLAKQLEAFRLEKSIPESQAKRRAPPPSILFTPAEAKQLDAEAFAALALRGIAAVAVTDPDIAIYGRLFEGPVPDRDMLTKEESQRLNSDIRKCLLLLSPHLPTRAAQECVEGLLSRYHAHQWNVDDLLCCALPYHDSPLFTRLLQGLHIEGKPKWQWLKKFKDGPLTLVRTAVSKYCAKDISLLTCIGSVIQETAQLQKSNRVLATFYSAVWLDTLATSRLMSADLVEAALPTLLIILRKPHLRDFYHAALTLASALCLKADLSASTRAQLLDRVVRHIVAPGAEGKASMSFVALHAQLQELDGVLSPKALKIMAAGGARAIAVSLPHEIDCDNVLIAIVRASLLAIVRLANHENGDGCDVAGEEELLEFTIGLFSEERLTQRYAASLVQAALSTFCEAGDARQKITGILSKPLATLGDEQPAVTSNVFKKVVDAALEAGVDPEPLVQLMAPSCAPINTHDGSKSSILPVVQAFSHKSVKVRCDALESAIKDLHATKGHSDQQRQKLLASLVLETVQDEALDVAKKTLQAKAVWSELPYVTPDMCVCALEALLLRSIDSKPAQQATGVNDMFVATLLGERQMALLPRALDCCSWIYARPDCNEEMRNKLDFMLLPVIIVAAVGLDLGSPVEEKLVGPGAHHKEEKQTRQLLRSSFINFCSTSGHPLLTNFSGGELSKVVAKQFTPRADFQLGDLSSAIALKVDLEQLPGLCSIVEGKPWGLSGLSCGHSLPLLCGATAQVSAAALLANTLPVLLTSVGKASTDTIGKIICRCTEACRHFAFHLSRTTETAKGSADTLCHLVRALLAGGATWNASRHEGAQSSSTSKKKKSRGGDIVGVSLLVASQQQTLASLLTIILDRPNAMKRELQLAVGSHVDLICPPLLQIGLGHVQNGQTHATTTNALVLIRSLMSSKTVPNWTPSQSILFPLVAQLATEDVPQVRFALLGLLEMLHVTDWSKSTPKSDTAMVGSLREAGVLRHPEDVLTQNGWNDNQTFFSKKTLEAFLEHCVASKAELLRDRSAIASALSKFVVSKSGIVKPAHVNACAVWTIGFAMLLRPLDEHIVGLLTSLPLAGVLGGIKEPLRLSMGEVISKLGDAKSTSLEIPSLVHVAAMVVLNFFQGETLANEESLEGHLREFLQQVAFPFCTGLAKTYEVGEVSKSDSIIQLADICCRIVAHIASNPSETSASSVGSALTAALGNEAAGILLKLCVACQLCDPTPDEGSVEDPIPSLPPSRRIAAAARGAFADVSLDAKRVRELLDSQSLRSKTTNTARARATMEALYPHIVALQVRALNGAGELLTALAELIKASLAWQKDENNTLFLNNTLSAIAALSEHLASPAGFALRIKIDVNAVCKAVGEVCETIGEAITDKILATIVRACSALASLLPPLPVVKNPDISMVSVPTETPAPLQTCIEALSFFSQSISVETMALLKVGLQRLTCYPDQSRGPDESEADAAMRRDLYIQSRLRPLMQSIILSPTLVEDPGADFALSFAQSAGMARSLDFVLFLLLARRVQNWSLEKKKKKKSSRKRRAAGEDAELLEEIGSLTRDVDDTADEALQLLTSIDMDCRFHCLGTLMQTICALANELCDHNKQVDGGPRGLGPLWGAALLPYSFLKSLGSDKAYNLLDVALTIVMRFIVEHGIPNALDEEDIDTSAYRSATLVTGIGEGARAAAGTMCYIVKGACLVEVLLKPGKESKPVGHLKACLDRAGQLRGLIMRSLAVNHPATFFRSICFSLQMPKFAPPAPKVGSSDIAELVGSETFVALAASTAALRERQDILVEAGHEDADIDDEVKLRCRPLCETAMRYICSEVLVASTEIEGESGREVAWQFLDRLNMFSAKWAPKPVLEVCVPAIVVCLKQATDVAGPSLKVAVASCSCLETVIAQLGRGIMEQLKVVTAMLLDLAACGGSGSADELDATVKLQKVALSTLRALINRVGKFMSPYLDRILQVTTVSSQQWRTKLLEDLGQELVQSVPHRLLLPAVQAASSAAVKRVLDIQVESGEENATRAIEMCLIEIQRLSAFQYWIFLKSKPDFVSANKDSAVASLLQLFAGGASASNTFLRLGCKPQDIPPKLFKRCLGTKLEISGASWIEHCSHGALSHLEVLSSGAFTQFALRLSFEELKPRFQKVLEWARNMQTQTLLRQSTRKAPADLSSEAVHDAEDTSRALALVAMMRSLVNEVPDIAEELLLPQVTKDLAACITAARRQAVQLAKAAAPPSAKKRRRAGLGVSRLRSTDTLPTNTWWWFDVGTEFLGFVAQALKQAGAGTNPSQTIEEVVDALSEPCTDALDIFEYLPSADGEGDTHGALSRDFLRSIQGALVGLTAAADSARVKRLLTGILSKSRAEDAEVRLCSVKACHTIWLELGVQAVSGLSEVVMFASELLEDEDPRVETAVRGMIKTMEECTGESLQDALKH